MDVTASLASPRINGFNRIFAAPVRMAFLGLMRLNFRGQATALKNYLNSPQLINFWQEFGGDINKLREAVNAGAAKAPLLGGGDAYDKALAQSIYAQIQQQINFTEWVANAVELGFVFPQSFPRDANGNIAIDMNNIQIVQSVMLAIANFLETKGQEYLGTLPAGTANQQQGAPVDPANLPTQNTNSPRVNEAATGAGVGAIVAAAIPILIAIPNLLQTLGWIDTPEAPATAGGQNVANNAANQGAIVTENTMLEQGAQAGASLTTVLLIGLGIYLLTKK